MKEKLSGCGAVLAVNSHFGELEAELDKANEGLTTIEDLLDSANEALPYMEDGIQQLQAFSDQGNLLLVMQSKPVMMVSIMWRISLQCEKLLAETKTLMAEAETKINSTEDLLRRCLLC